MADANDDEWLYGAEGDGEVFKEEEAIQEDALRDDLKGKNGTTENDAFDDHNLEEAGDDEHLIADDSKDQDDSNRDASSDDDDDDDDDDINVVIGDIKSGGPSARFPDQKQKQPGSKFNIEEFESVGTINGQPSIEFAIESIEDKPWRKPGADITDYFNYGFNEETWRAYCERQKRMRIHESGIGLASLTAAQNPQGMQQITATGSGQEGDRRPINIGFKRMGPRPPKPIDNIAVIGSASQNLNRPPAPRENVIQVMTADRREYSRTVQPPMQMQPFNIPPEEFYNHEEQDAFNYGYEPTQDSQWDPNQQQPWAPGEIKQLTPINQPPPNIQQIRPLGMNVPPPHMMGNPQMIPPLMGQHMPMHIKQEMEDKRDMRRMGGGGRDMRDERRGGEDRKRMRERSTSRDRDLRKSDRRDDRRSDRDRYARESSSRRRSKSREKKRSRSREKSRRSRSKERKTGDDKERRRDDKSSKRPSSSSSTTIKEEK